MVAGEGVMQKNQDGTFRLTPSKGFARMETKRLTDHLMALGCRPGLNIDGLRGIGVCEAAEQLRAAQKALGKAFEGGGRVKSGFDVEDGSAFFHLRTVLTNVVADFGMTFAELARERVLARDVVLGQLAEHDGAFVRWR